MKPEVLDKIFDVYFQAPQTENLRLAGTGIGLSLVRQFVERHSGEVLVQSQEGVGTTFTLHLPFGCAHLAPADMQTDAPDSELALADASFAVDLASRPDGATLLPIPLSASGQGPCQLLLVEDNDEVRRYLQQLFEPDFVVTTAADGLEGWEKALTLLPDLIISDVMMPHSDGLELCRKIKQHPKTLHIPVVLLTARTAAMHEQEGLEHGADDYIAKPFNASLLQIKVITLLQNRDKMREYYQRQILLEPTEVTVPDADKAFLEKAMRIAEANLAEPEFNVQVLVREMGMSQSVFYRRLKGITGQSVIEFIRDVRMKRAAQLLAHTQLRISEIAYQVGIDDSKYFRKTFQKIYNMAPSEYAKQHRTSSTPEHIEY